MFMTKGKNISPNLKYVCTILLYYRDKMKIPCMFLRWKTIFACSITLGCQPNFCSKSQTWSPYGQQRHTGDTQERKKST
uniref:Uncharacterized protein n=1 Tax=Oryza brachyantha TaxID=4533 RepID=J3M8Z1_ORYBR